MSYVSTSKEFEKKPRELRPCQSEAVLFLPFSIPINSYRSLLRSQICLVKHTKQAKCRSYSPFVDTSRRPFAVLFCVTTHRSIRLLLVLISDSKFALLLPYPAGIISRKRTHHYLLRLNPILLFVSVVILSSSSP